MGVSGSSPPAPRAAGPRPSPRDVTLVLYNLQRRVDASKSSLLHSAGFGLFHSGIVVFGREWAFGGRPDAPPELSGIFPAVPRSVLPPSQFHDSVPLGTLPPAATEPAVLRVLHDMSAEWRAASYHMLGHNCNHFAEAFRGALGRAFGIELAPIPGFVNRAARVADFVIPDAIYRSMMRGVPQPPQQQPATHSNNSQHQSKAVASGGGDDDDAAAKVPLVGDPAQLRAMTVRELKTMMWLHGISFDGCIEKSDLVAAIVSALRARTPQNEAAATHEPPTKGA